MKFTLLNLNTRLVYFFEARATYRNIRDRRYVLSSFDELGNEGKQCSYTDRNSIGDRFGSKPEGGEAHGHDQSGRYVDAGDFVGNIAGKPDVDCEQ